MCLVTQHGFSGHGDRGRVAEIEPGPFSSLWHWYIEGAMLVNGLGSEVWLEFGLTLIGFAVGWWAFLRRDLHNP